MGKISRRTFLHSAAMMGGAAGSGENIVNRLVSYANPPLPTRPGVWSHFATVCRECPAGCGMQLSFRDGRVTKAEGNPVHPVNAGRLCARGQSSVQGLYDPDRLQEPHCRAGGSYREATWDEALQAISARIGSSPAGRVAVISGLETGTLAGLMRQFASTFGSDRILMYEPVGYEALTGAHAELFGRKSIPRYRLDRCDFIISFAADFLETWISPVEFSRQFAAMHTPVNGSMGRLAYVGPRFSMTAANADDFFMVPPGSERYVALAMVDALVKSGQVKGDAAMVSRAAAALGSAAAVNSSPLLPDKIARLAAAFGSARSALALAGPSCDSSPRARDTAIAAALLNYAAGSIGQSVDFSMPHALSSVAGSAESARFFDGITGQDTVIIHDSNIAYTTPAAMQAIRRAGMVVYLATLPDETASVADWVLPIDSPLESWGDYEPWTLTRGLMQPTMNRLYDSMEAGDIFLSIAKTAGKPLGIGDYRSLVKENWLAKARLAGGVAPDKHWENSLRAGGVFEASSSGTLPGIKADLLPFAPECVQEANSNVAEAFLYPSVMLFDGRLSNRGWLQEVPDPVTSSTWGSCIEMHPAKAAALSLKEGDVAELKSNAGSCRAPIRITDEVERNTVALQLGQGHRAGGLTTARGIGTNGFALIAPGQGSIFGRVSIAKIGHKETIAYAAATDHQFHRDILQGMTLSALRAMKPGDGPELTLPLPAGYRRGHDLFPPVKPQGHRWAMAVDLHRCTGCGACAVACQAENNVAVVGRADSTSGKEMAWLKIPPYRLDGPGRRIGWLPIFCQQCDAAPCESVCPVFASVHSEEGLNAQIYNRCIGTRYCSNNCPYKVRRFNWKNITWRQPLDKQLNPEVTVRCRGVMEKCTFCVQRIRQAEYRATIERRPVREGEIAPACVQTCPTGALVFGDLLNSRSAVCEATLRDPRRYHLLEELNTKPAVTFLKRVVNDGVL